MSYAFLVPTAAAALAAWLPKPWRLLLPTAALALLWWPMALILPEALGLDFTWLSALCAAVLATPLLPLAAVCERKVQHRGLALLALAWSVSLLGAQALPKFNDQLPSRVNVSYHLDADTQRAQWVLDSAWATIPWGPVPPKPCCTHRACSLRTAAPCHGSHHPARTALHPRSHCLHHARNCCRRHTRMGNTRTLELLLRSPRGAPRVLLFLPRARPHRAWVEGKEVWSSVSGVFYLDPTWQAISVRTTPAEGVHVRLELQGPEAVEGLLVDQAPTVPPEAAALLQRRPTTAVPYQDGDVSYVSTHVSW